MSTETTRLERNRESVRRWYANNREKFAKLRRKRYRADPERREKARKAAAEYRRARREGEKVRRTLLREIGGKTVEVFTSGYVSDRIKYSPQVLRGWEERGWIPATLFPEDKHRLYTAHQVALMKLLADATRQKAGRRKSASLVLDEVITLIHKTWGVIENADQKGRQKARRTQRRGRKG